MLSTVQVALSNQLRSSVEIVFALSLETPPLSEGDLVSVFPRIVANNRRCIISSPLGMPKNTSLRDLTSYGLDPNQELEVFAQCAVQALALQNWA